MKKMIAAAAFLVCGVLSLVIMYCTAVEILWSRGTNLLVIINSMGLGYFIISILVIILSTIVIIRELLKGEEDSE